MLHSRTSYPANVLSEHQSSLSILIIADRPHLILVNSTSDTLHAHSTNRAASNVLHSRNRKSLLIIVSRGDRATKRTALERSRNDVLALDTEDVETVAYPVRCNVAQDNAEADQWNDVRDTCVCCIGDSALDWREDGTACIGMSVAESKTLQSQEEIAYLKHP